ncbi:MAG: hypothetical protein WCT04_09895 [Planctomycetota bacterium]
MNNRLCILIVVTLSATWLGASENSVTFNKDIAPILFQNCTGCHRPGEVAPFDLITYQDASKRAKQLARVTQSRYMPPWKAEPGHGEFLDERRLTTDQLALIKNWADNGAPEGVAADLPAAPKFTDGWKLGEPDLVVKMPDSFTLQAEGRDVFRCFVIPLKLDADTYVSAIDFRPGNRKIVHHALFFLDSNGVAAKKTSADGKPGFESFGSPGFVPTGGLGGWAPGYTPRPLPDGMGKLVKKGSDLVIQIHFHPSGKEEQEQSTLGLYFTKKTPDKVVASIPIGSRKIDIAAGATNYKVTKDFTVPIDAEVVGLTPHAHYLCKEMKVTATLPDGSKKSMIWIKDWDFSWQDQYLYKTPMKLPKGTNIAFEYTYDNSADNPRNPSNPPKAVKWGHETNDEMALVFLSYVSKSQSDAATVRRAALFNGFRDMVK